MKKNTDQSQKSLYLEYQSAFAPLGQHIMNRARLVGREVERNIANVTGHAEKIAKMAPHAYNPFTDMEQMKNVAKDMDQKIEDRLNNVDARYQDVIDALRQAAGNSDFQAFIAMLSPGLFFGQNVIRNSPAKAAAIVNALSGQRTPGLVQAANRFQQSVATRPHPANQGHSSVSGSGGGGDYGDDYGGYFEGVEKDLMALNEKGEVVPNQQQAASLQQQMKNPAVIKAFQDIQNAAIDQLASSFSAKLKIQNLQPEARKAEVQKFLNLWLPKIQSPNGKKRLQIRVSPLMK